MKTLYLQCNMGIAGDMLTAALYELLEDKEGFLAVANQLLPQVTVTAEPSEKQGICGTHLSVRVNSREEEQGIAERHLHSQQSEHHHPHTSLSHIRSVLSGLPVSQHVKEQAAQVYDFLAHAEAKAHGCPVDRIHFHEVGELDAIADITLACLALELLEVEQVICSPVCTGFGQVRCAHGTLPVPAPATAWLLEGVPAYAGTVEGELTTPTGAALVSVLADRFEQMPLMVTRKLGYGMGKKDFPQAANCVRAFLGETREQPGTVTELVCSIDDMTPERQSYASARLMELGALDVTIVPAVMKKGRPGHLLTVLASAGQAEQLADAVLRETTTNGLRLRTCERRILTPSVTEKASPFGPVRIKRAEGHGAVHAKPEYEDVSAIARREGLPIEQVYRILTGLI
ncbi:MAG: nickel pincer cofactor biosynthesis protein LarC [Oscillospiraceae bacterium]|nr:nickel pincer cofactor biosynthesis protein LarC [Oscillospiraceae bacterium]